MNLQDATLRPDARCDCGHARDDHVDAGMYDECSLCDCTELRFGEWDDRPILVTPVCWAPDAIPPTVLRHLKFLSHNKRGGRT